MTPEEALIKLTALTNRRKEADKKYREKHRDELLAKRRQYYAENKDAMREKNTEYQRSYRAKKLAPEASTTPLTTTG
jgi:shikimate kinase